MQAANASPASQPREVVERVQKTASALGCAGLWVRATGPYILLGLNGGDAFARLTALGGASYGLAFRGPLPANKRGPAIGIRSSSSTSSRTSWSTRSLECVPFP